MLTFLWYIYAYGFCCLLLGVLLRPERFQTDFNANWGPWTIGPVIFTALALWPLLGLYFTGKYFYHKINPEKITLDDEDLFLEKPWTEETGKGIVKKPLPQEGDEGKKEAESEDHDHNHDHEPHEEKEPESDEKKTESGS